MSFHKISTPGNWVKLRYFLQWVKQKFTLKLANKNQVIIIVDSQTSLVNTNKITHWANRKCQFLIIFFLVINFVKVNLIVFSWFYQRFTRLVLSFCFFIYVSWSYFKPKLCEKTWYNGPFLTETFRNSFLNFSDWMHLSLGLAKTVFALAATFDDLLDLSFVLISFFPRLIFV